jgi:hypothetical protein
LKNAGEKLIHMTSQDFFLHPRARYSEVLRKNNEGYKFTVIRIQAGTFGGVINIVSVPYREHILFLN